MKEEVELPHCKSTSDKKASWDALTSSLPVCTAVLLWVYCCCFFSQLLGWVTACLNLHREPSHSHADTFYSSLSFCLGSSGIAAWPVYLVTQLKKTTEQKEQTKSFQKFFFFFLIIIYYFASCTVNQNSIILPASAPMLYTFACDWEPSQIIWLRHLLFPS